MSRTAERERQTAETRIRLSLDLDGGEASADTGVGFLDHMLDLLARHGRLGLKVEANGDLETGAHHTVEDVGIVFGQALDEALGDRAGIRRYGSGLGAVGEAPGEGPAAPARRGCGWTSPWPSARSTSPAAPTATSPPSCRSSRSPASTAS